MNRMIVDESANDNHEGEEGRMRTETRNKGT